jgi:hypothetical protein
MKRSACGAVLIAFAAAVLNAQSTPTVSIQPPVMSSAQSVTLKGCITRGATAADPFTLSDAVRLAPMTVPESSITTPAPAGAGLAGTTGRIPTAGTAGGSASAAVGAVGTAGTGSSEVTTSGLVTHLVEPEPALVLPPSMSHLVPPSIYQLSGTSVRSYVGQSVFVTGMVVPSPNVAATPGAESSGVSTPAGSTDVIAAPVTPPTLPSFHVARVESMGIPCPPQ